MSSAACYKQWLIMLFCSVNRQLITEHADQENSLGSVLVFQSFFEGRFYYLKKHQADVLS